MPEQRVSPSRDGARSRQTFRLYAAHGRVYASNVRQKLIDLGSLTEDGATFSYQLDGDNASGSGFADAIQALRDIGGRVSFLYLDGQFTALADLRERSGAGLRQAAQVEVTLDELGKGEAAVNADI